MDLEHVIRFRPEPEAEHSAPKEVLSGAPEQTIRNVYTDSSGAFSTGIWESTPGKWPVEYTEDEFCLLLAGVVELIDARGRSARFSAGDAFVITAGFKGIKRWFCYNPTNAGKDTARRPGKLSYRRQQYAWRIFGEVICAGVGLGYCGDPSRSKCVWYAGNCFGRADGNCRWCGPVWRLRRLARETK